MHWGANFGEHTCQLAVQCSSPHIACLSKPLVPHHKLSLQHVRWQLKPVERQDGKQHSSATWPNHDFTQLKASQSLVAIFPYACVIWWLQLYGTVWSWNCHKHAIGLIFRLDSMPAAQELHIEECKNVQQQPGARCCYTLTWPNTTIPSQLFYQLLGSYVWGLTSI